MNKNVRTDFTALSFLAETVRDRLAMARTIEEVIDRLLELAAQAERSGDSLRAARLMRAAICVDEGERLAPLTVPVVNWNYHTQTRCVPLH